MLSSIPRVRRAAVLCMPVLAGALGACSSTTPPQGITAVTPYALARYEGRWYEVARFDHAFERGMTDVSATYQGQVDGAVRMINRGFDTGRNDWHQSVGKAVFTGDAQTASLKVSFFGPGRNYGWILSRTKLLAPALREQLIARASALGIDTQALIWVAHERTDPQP